MKLLESHYYEDARLNKFHRCIYRYDLKNGFNRQMMEYVPIKYMKTEKCL